MTIAKRGNQLIVRQGLLARSCNCCQQTNTCGLECPQALEDIAEDITFTVTLTQWQEISFGNPSPFFAGQIIPCTFSRMQASIVGDLYAVYSSDPSVSQSAGTSAIGVEQYVYDSAIVETLDRMQRPQNLVELFLPCNPNIAFTSGLYVITKFFATWTWVRDPPPLFGPPSYEQYDFRTNMPGSIRSGRPLVNCELSLSQKQNVLGYPFAFDFGNQLIGFGYFDLQLEVNPLP